MAQSKVTGEIGDDKVVLENIATEATLQSLLAAFDKMSKAKGETPEQLKSRKKAADELSKSQKEATETTKSFEESVSEAGTALDNLASGLGMLGGALGFVKDIFVGLSGAAAGLTVDFMRNGDKLSDLITTDFLFLRDLAQSVDDNIHEFRTMAAVGATFGNSLLETRLTAARANLSLDQFSQFVTKNAETLAIFGSTTQSGARQLSDLSRRLINSDLGTKLQGMGFTIEGINDGLANYVEIQARTGRLESRNTNQLIQGTNNYLEEVDALARVTGMQREEAQQAMLASMEEAKFRTMRGRIESEEGRLRFDANLAFMKQLGITGTSMMDLSDGAASTAEAANLVAALGPRIIDLSQAMASGTIDVEQSRNQLASMGPAAQRFTENFSAASFEHLPPALRSTLDGLYSIIRLNDLAVPLTEDEIARRKRLTEALTTFQRSVRAIKENIMEAFLTSGVFQDVSGQLKKFAEYLTPEKVTQYFNELANNLSWVNSWYERAKEILNGYLNTYKEEGLSETVKQIANDFMVKLNDFLFGESQTTTPGEDGERINRKGGVLDKIASGFTSFIESETFQNIFQNMADAIVEAIKNSLTGRDSLVKQGTSQLPGGGATFSEAQELTRRAAAGETLSDRELAKLQLAMREENRRLAVESDSGLFNFLGRTNQILGLVLDPLSELATRSNIPGTNYLDLERAQELFGIDAENHNRFGTGQINNYGNGTRAMLHGREAVLTEDQLFNMANGALAAGTKNAVGTLNQTLAKQKDDQSTQMLTNAVTELKNSVTNTANNTQTTTNNSLDNKIDQLNNTMESVLSVLMESNGMNKKQLNATRSMSGNLVYGVPS